MARQPRYRSPLYRLEAFGITNDWNVWSFAHGGMDAWCVRCRGVGILIDSWCYAREAKSHDITEACTRQTGCSRCRRRCPACHGARITPSDILRTEDFGDAESRTIAERTFRITVDDRHPRIDRLGLR